MNCHGTAGNAAAPDSPIILVGNPNVGKSVIFGRLTGRYVTVANYPGTTVELSRGTLPDGTPIIDTPGINSLSGGSDDERKFKEYLRRHQIPTQVWFRAYPGLTAVDLERHALVRRGIEAAQLGGQQAREWAELL